MPTTTAAEPRYLTYKVQRGESVKSVAAKHNISVDQLCSANNLTSRSNEELQAILSQRPATKVLEPHRAASFVGVFDLSARALAGTEISLTVHDGVPPKAAPAVTKAAAAAPPEKPTPTDASKTGGSEKSP